LIFVTVGGMRAFDRLIREMDRIACELDEQVIMQIGSTDYEPQNCAYSRFISRSDMERLCADARVIVAHAGTGSILTALEHSRPIVLVPRLKKFGEAFDDHQLEIARQLEAQGVAVVYEMDNLEVAIRSGGTPLPQLSTGGSLVGRLKEYLGPTGPINP